MAYSYPLLSYTFIIFSFSTGFLLAGNNPVAKRFKDARAKSIEIINLVRLNGLLKGQLTFDRLGKLEALDSEEFMGSAYQPATNASVSFGDSKPAAAKTEAKGPAAVKKEAKKASAVNAAEIPPLESDEDAKPAAAATSQALVAHANPSESTSSTAVVPAPGKKSRFQMPRPGQNGAIADVFDGQRFGKLQVTHGLAITALFKCSQHYCLSFDWAVSRVGRRRRTEFGESQDDNLD